MKKHLLAVAVASTLAAPAMAQNAQIYGVFGLNYMVTNNSIGTADTAALNSSSAGNINTTVIGLRGSEDLGGGLKVGFNFEGGLSDFGTVGNGAYDANQGSMFNRLANIYAEVPNVGKFTVGRVGDLIDSNEGYANHINLFDTEAADEGGLGNKNAETVRFDSQKLFGGLTLSVADSRDARQTSTATTTTLTDQKTFSYAAVWGNGPLTAGFASGGAGQNGGSTSSADVKIDTMYVGYMIMGADVRVQQTKEQTTTSGLSTKTTEASVKYGLGNGYTLYAHYEKANVSNDDDSDYKQIGLAITKDLSKRTMVYAGYRDRDLAGAASTHTDVMVTTIGIEHKF